MALSAAVKKDVSCNLGICLAKILYNIRMILERDYSISNL